jgi:hypothetical protein
VNFTRAAVALGHFKAIVAGQFVLACHAKAPAKSYPGSFIAADMHSITCAMASVDGKPDHFRDPFAGERRAVPCPSN